MNDRKITRVVLADDHPMFRYGVAAALASASEIELVGEAAKGEELLVLVERTEPDVVVTDLAMPGTDGAAACRQLLERRPGLAVVVLTMHDDDDSVFAAMQAGARGYVLKGADRAELIHAITTVADGHAIYGSAVAGRIAQLLRGPESARPVDQPFPDLTPRERQVLELVAQGARNSEIARQLGMTDKTVRNHVSSILTKLQAPDRTSAALKARDATRPAGPRRPDWS